MTLFFANIAGGYEWEIDIIEMRNWNLQQFSSAALKSFISLITQQFIHLDKQKNQRFDCKEPPCNLCRISSILLSPSNFDQLSSKSIQI